MKYYKEPDSKAFFDATYLLENGWGLELGMSHSLKITAWVLLKFKLDLLGTEEVRWGNSNTEPTHNFTFFYKSGNEDH
jgi:hypothetical protein